MPHDGATQLAARPRWAAFTAHTKACRKTAPDQPCRTMAAHPTIDDSLHR
jgi:hypothetical protein